MLKSIVKGFYRTEGFILGCVSFVVLSLAIYGYTKADQAVKAESKKD